MEIRDINEVEERDPTNLYSHFCPFLFSLI